MIRRRNQQNRQKSIDMARKNRYPSQNHQTSKCWQKYSYRLADESQNLTVLNNDYSNIGCIEKERNKSRGERQPFAMVENRQKVTAKDRSIAASKQKSLKRQYLYDETDNDLKYINISLNKDKEEAQRQQWQNTSMTLNTSQEFRVRVPELSWCNEEVSTAFHNRTMPVNCFLLTGRSKCSYEMEKERQAIKQTYHRKHLQKKEETESDLEAKYQQLWSYNQQLRERNQRLCQNENQINQIKQIQQKSRAAANMIINSRPSQQQQFGKIKQKNSKIKATQCLQVNQVIAQSRDIQLIDPATFRNINLNLKQKSESLIKTKPTTPLRSKSILSKNNDAIVTMRQSPTTHKHTQMHNDQLQERLRLIDNFSSKLSSKIQQITDLLEKGKIAANKL